MFPAQHAEVSVAHIWLIDVHISARSLEALDNSKLVYSLKTGVFICLSLQMHVSEVASSEASFACIRIAG